jgi:putative ABC transport system permease protein
VRLLRLISWPYVRKHGVRSVLTTAGIVLGVAVFVAMYTANQAVIYGFQRTVDRVAGAAQLQVTAGDGGFAEDVLERVQAVPQVSVAVPIIEAVLSTNLPGQGNLLLLGVDMTGDRSLRTYDLDSGDEEIVDDPLVFLAQPDSIIVTREFASRNHLDVGSRLTLGTVEGDRPFTVRGIMRSGGLSSAFGGDLAVMDIYAAQRALGRDRLFDRIELKFADGVSLDAGRAAIEKSLGGGFQVETPASRSQQFESTLAVYSLTMRISSLFALFIGMFIIYNSFAIAVTQRRSEIGILRALGATRAQIRGLFLTESAISGVIGSVLGVLAGTAMARWMVGYISGMLEGIFGIAERADEVAADPRLFALAVAVGVVTSMIAAWLPARSAARVDPVHALQKGKYQVLTEGENRARRLWASVMLVLGLVFLWIGRSGWFYASFVLVIGASLLLVPTVALRVTRLLRPWLKRLRPVEGALAADSLIQSPRRTSGAVAALMLSLGQVVGLGGVARASYADIVDWVTSALNPDLYVTASQNLADRTFRFPQEVGTELKGIEGVDEVQPVRSLRLMMGKTAVMLVAVDIEGLQRRARRPVLAEVPEGMYPLAIQGKGFIISDNLVRRQGLQPGQKIALPSPTGPVELPVVGVTRDWSDQQGTIFVDRALYRERWQDDTASLFRVYVKKGLDPMQVRQRILERVGGQRRLLVLTNTDVRRYILRLTDQWLQLTYTQVFIAVLVAVLGIVNTLTVSIIDRRRELGVLRAVGGLRRQIRHTIWMEAVTIGVVGLVLGLSFGAADLYYLLEMSRRDLMGVSLPYHYPVQIGAMLVPIILAAAFISALWPAESAVRSSLVEALEYE